MAKKILVVAWMMPPLVFPRSLQISRALRALKFLGWESDVLAVTPEVERHAIKDLQLESIYKGSYTINYIDPREDVVPSSIFIRFFRYLRGIKDTLELNWISRATNYLKHRIKWSRPNAMISFAQPWISHQVALRVKKCFPLLPWIAHFSDPWVDSSYFKPKDLKDRMRAIRCEAEIIKFCDAVIFTNREAANLVMKKYPKSWSSKVSIVAHGYDSELLVGLGVSQRDKNDAIVITHTGNLYEGREPISFLMALVKIKNQHPEFRFTVNFIGHASFLMREIIQELKLGDIVKIREPVNYFDSLKLAKQADLLLVIDAPADLNVFLPSKVVDYLALRRPILGLTPLNGPTAKLLGDLSFAVLDPEDELGIMREIKNFINTMKNEQPYKLPEPEEIAKFSIENTSLHFEAAINRVIKNA